MAKKKLWKRITAVALAAVLTIPAGLIPIHAEAGDNLVANGTFDTVGSWFDESGAEIAAQTLVDDVTIHELVENGGFENGSYQCGVNGWQCRGGATLSVTAEAGNADNKVLQAVAEGGGAQVNFYFGQADQVTIGKTYTVSFDIRRVDGSGGLTLYTDLIEGGWESHGWKNLSESWTTLSYELTPASASAWAQIGFQFDAAATVEVDNFSIAWTEAKTQTVTVNLVENGGFENGSYQCGVNGWQCRGGATLSVTAEAGNADNKVLQAVAEGGGAQVNFYFGQADQVTIGKTYTVSFDIRRVDGSGGLTLYTDLIEGGWESHGWKNLSESWTTLSYELTPASASAWAQIGFQFDAAATVEVDNFSMTYSEGEQVVKTYSDGIGNCNSAEYGNVLAMKANTKAAQTISVKAGTTYYYSYKVKTLDTDGEFDFYMAVGSEQHRPALSTGTWDTVSGQFTATGMTAELSFNKSGTGTVLIDDVEVFQDTSSETGVVLRFAVVSDTHIAVGSGALETSRQERLAKVFQTAYSYTQTQDYKNLDAVVVVGDMVNTGTAEEYQLFNQIVNSNIQSGTKLITLAGNHEFWGSNDATNYKTYLDKETDKSSLDTAVTVKGYQFIALSQRDNDVYTDEQATWLEEKLNAADGSGNQKPVFTFQHFGVKDTVYGTTGSTFSPADILHAKYENHAHVINFSGHTHAPINTPTIISQKNGYTQIGTGTTYDMYLENDASYGTQPPNSNDIAQYYIVEVSADNTVQIMPYNILADNGSGAFFKTPATEDGDAQLIYSVDVNDPDNWNYIDGKQETAAPYFAANAEMSFSKLTYKGGTITFPQAKDADSGVYRYEITCTPVSKVAETKIYSIFSEYYFEPMPATLSYAIAGLEADTQYTVSVVPIDFFGNKGEAITGTMYTQSADEKLTLTFAGYHSTDKWIQFNLNNQYLLTGSYYSLPVTADGKDGCVAVSNGSGTLTVWSSFVTAIDSNLSVNESLLIEAGAKMEQVSTSWSVVPGGDQETVSQNVYLEMVGNTLVDKTDAYNLLENAEAEISKYSVNTATTKDKQAILSILTDVQSVESNTEYLTQRIDAVKAACNSILEALRGPAKVKLWNISLRDEVAANFLVDVAESVLDQATLEVSLDGKTVQYAAAEITPDEAGLRLITAKLAAAQMTQPITVKLIVNEEVTVLGTYTVRGYADYLLTDSKNEFTDAQKNMVKAMLAYGGAAQRYFRYNTEAMADDGISLTPAAVPEEISDYSADGSVTGIQYYGATLLFQSKTALRYYFVVSGDAADYTFTVGGQSCTPIQKDGMYYVEITNINPQDLDKMVELTVSCGSETLMVSYSPMHYIVRKHQTGSDSLKALLQAMYGYHLAAVELAAE